MQRTLSGVLAAGVVYGLGKLAGYDVNGWVLVAAFLVGRFLLPSLVGLAGGVAKGSPASELDESVLMMQGERPAPGTPGKVIVIERWATWCPPCVATIPHLNELHAKYGGRPDFEIVGVTDEQDQTKIRAFMQQHGMAYPVAIDTQGVVARGYPSMGIPNATVVGKNGRVYWNGHPMGMDGPLQEALNGAVAGEPAAANTSSAATSGSESKNRAQ